MDERARIGIGIVGLGMVAPAHLRALADLADRATVRGIYSRDSERSRQIAAEFDMPVASSLDALLGDPGIAIMIILTPPNARLEIVERCAAAGKHVLLEKPIERNTRAALEIVEICERAGVTLGVAFQHRFRLASQKLKEIADSASMGPIACVQISVPWWRPQSYYDQPGRGTYARDGGGVLISQAIHTLDLVGSIAGEIAEVQAMAGTTRLHRMEAEDFVGAGLRFASGAFGALCATTASFPGGTEFIQIDFDKGSARLQGGLLTVHASDGEISCFGEEAGTGGGADPLAFPHSWHRDLIADFIDAVQSGRAPAVTGREALKVHRLIDALTLSARERRAVMIAEIDATLAA